MADLREFEVRVPDVGDADRIAQIHVQGWAEAYAHLLPAEFYGTEALREREKMWRSILSRDELPPRLRVAARGEEVLGFALAGATRGEAAGEAARDLQLYAIYVTAENYGSGAGQALLEGVLGSEPAQLWVAKENPRAIAFYSRNGFQPDGAQKLDESANGLLEIRLTR